LKWAAIGGSSGLLAAMTNRLFGICRDYFV
jgi:hypothetical protein